MASKRQLVDLDMESTSKIVNLPAASANGHAVRYEEFIDVDGNVNDLISAMGIAENASDLGSFTGSTIPNSSSVKDALQALETEVEQTSLTIATESQSVLSITGNELKMESLAITDVEVDTTETSLANWISNNPTHNLEMGDVLILTSASDKMEMTWICNSNTPSQSPASASDFTRLQADIQANDVRSFLAGTADEIDYNSTTGVFSFSANAAENILPTSHTWVGLSAPSSVQDFMELADQEFTNLQSGTSLTVGSVTTAKLAADAVTNAKLADDAVETANIADLQVTTSKLALLSVNSARIAADAVTNAKLADDAVHTDNILDAQITLAKMASNSVDSNQYVDGSIDSVHLSADCIDGTKIADSSIDSEHYVNGSIDLAHLSSDSVDGSKIADNSIDSEHYVDASIDFEHLCSTCYTTDLSSSAGSDELARADAIKSYVDGRTYVRKLFSAQSLTANTGASLNHALSNKYVSVQVFDDSTDKEVDFQLTLTDANNCEVEVTVSGTYSVLVIG